MEEALIPVLLGIVLFGVSGAVIYCVQLKEEYDDKLAEQTKELKAQTEILKENNGELYEFIINAEHYYTINNKNVVFNLFDFFKVALSIYRLDKNNYWDGDKFISKINSFFSKDDFELSLCLKDINLKSTVTIEYVLAFIITNFDTIKYIIAKANFDQDDLKILMHRYLTMLVLQKVDEDEFERIVSEMAQTYFNEKLGLYN